VQRSVANVLGIKNSSCIDVQIKQIGGGFGGKTTRANIVATAASVAAHHLRKPVKIFMDLNDCMVLNFYSFLIGIYLEKRDLAEKKIFF
jgi:xanthine dehydrogenase/oxidase